MSNSIEKNKGLQNEVHKRKLRIEEHRDEATAYSECKIQLHQLQMQYSEMKNLLREEQYRLYLFEAYDQGKTGESDSVEQVAKIINEEDIKVAVGSLRKYKEQLEDVNNNFEIVADNVETTSNALLEATKSLEEAVKNYEIKKQKLIDVYNISVATCTDANTGDNKDLGSALAAVKEVHRHLEDMLDKMISSDQLTDMFALIGQCTDMAMKYRECIDSLRSTGVARKAINWCNKCLDLVNSVRGMEDLGVDDGAWIVGIHGHSQGTGEPGLLLKVTLKFTWSRPSQPMLASVKTSCCDLDSTDIIREAKAKNDVAFLLKELKRMWDQHYPVLHEMYTLRQKYALDWVQESRSIYVIYGKQSNVICHLKINSGYPDLRKVTLESVKSDLDLDITVLKPEKADATLTEWLDYLNDVLTKDPPQ